MTEQINTTDKLPLEIEDYRWEDNLLKLLWFKGHIKVGGYLVGDDYYSNKILEIKFDGENTDVLYCKERVFSNYLTNEGVPSHLIANVEIVLEKPYVKSNGRAPEIRGFVETQPPARSAFRVSKSN